MRLHEWQSLALLQNYRIPVPLGDIAHSGKEAKFQARNIARANDYKAKFIIKAQVQVAQRGKGYFMENGFVGGIHKAESPEEVEEIAQ